MLCHAVGCNQCKAARDRPGIQVCDRCSGAKAIFDHILLQEKLCLSSYLSAQLVAYELATYKLDRDNQSAYVTAAANMQHAQHPYV